MTGDVRASRQLLVILGVLVLLAGCGSSPSSTSSSSRTQAELWGKALSDFRSAGSGTYASRDELTLCIGTSSDLSAPCKDVTRTLDQHGSFTLDPLSLSDTSVSTRSEDPSHPLRLETIVTSDGHGFAQVSGTGDCWGSGAAEAFGGAVGTQDSPLPAGIQALLKADVSSHAAGPRLPGEIVGSAPAQLLVSFADHLIGLSTHVPGAIRAPVHLLLDRDGAIAGISVRGSEVVKAILADPREPSVDWGDDNGAPGANASVLVTRNAHLRLDDLGAAPAVSPPPADELCPKTG